MTNKTNKTNEIYLKDYLESNYLVKTINLEFDLNKSKTKVTNISTFYKNSTSNTANISKNTNLELD